MRLAVAAKAVATRRPGLLAVVGRPPVPGDVQRISGARGGVAADPGRVQRVAAAVGQPRRPGRALDAARRDHRPQPARRRRRRGLRASRRLLRARRQRRGEGLVLYVRRIRIGAACCWARARGSARACASTTASRSTSPTWARPPSCAAGACSAATARSRRRCCACYCAPRAAAFDARSTTCRARRSDARTASSGSAAATDYGRSLGLREGDLAGVSARRVPVVDYADAGALDRAAARRATGRASRPGERAATSRPRAAGRGQADPVQRRAAGSFRSLFAIWAHDLLRHALRPRSGRDFMSVSPQLRQQRRLRRRPRLSGRCGCAR